MHERELEVRQATIKLPYFDYMVLILYMDDGVLYIPVIALCEMLGLRAHILWNLDCLHTIRGDRDLLAPAARMASLACWQERSLVSQ